MILFLFNHKIITIALIATIFLNSLTNEDIRAIFTKTDSTLRSFHSLRHHIDFLRN